VPLGLVNFLGYPIIVYSGENKAAGLYYPFWQSLLLERAGCGVI
jgi:hypothetical protein